MPERVAIAVHGGAGLIEPTRMTVEREAACRAGLATALDAGYAILERDGTSLDAVTEAVRLLEDDPQFNAGRGAVLTHEGAAELDASIMDGRTLSAGAVAGVRHVMNPIELARLVMEKSPYVMLIGEGAEEFALQEGMVLVPNTYFRTYHREQELQRALQREQHDQGAPSPRGSSSLHEPGGAGGSDTGTVGAVALDRAGNLAAATSTGGASNKRYRRVGDSPIIGAGTYANNESCAVSATGDGEFFIRGVIAFDIHALLTYKPFSLERAVREVIQRKLTCLGGRGGVIAVDNTGRIAIEFNSPGMFRGARDSDGRREIALFSEDGR